MTERPARPRHGDVTIVRHDPARHPIRADRRTDRQRPDFHLMTFALALTRRRRTAARLLVCCLVGALAICGFASLQVGLLGTNHSHTEAARAARSVTVAMAGWQDFRRGGHAARAASASRHAHGLLQRHHHAAQDSSVVSLDAEGSASLSGEAASGSGAPVGAMLAADTLFSAAARSAAVTRWPEAATRGIERIESGRLERPPRG
jgi:hypothetical protein